MKKFKKIVLCALAVLLLITCAGCSALVEALEDEKSRGYTELMLDSIVSGDLDSAYAVFSDIYNKDDFAPAFYELKNVLKDVESYELKLLSVYRNTSVTNGSPVSEIASVYEMSTNSGKYIVNVKANSLCPKLSSFYIAPFEDTDYYYNGTIGSMKDANVLQWAALLSNLLIIGFMVFALVDCCRHKVKLKALWIIIILIGLFTVGITVSSGNLNFNLNLGWLTAYNAIIIYGGGTVSARAMIPIGAAVYFILRHWIIKKPADIQPLPEENILPEETEYAPAEEERSENTESPE